MLSEGSVLERLPMDVSSSSMLQPVAQLPEKDLNTRD